MGWLAILWCVCVCVCVCGEGVCVTDIVALINGV